MYVCQICKKAPATIHLTDIHNNVKKELHMCESCAAEKGFNMQTAANLPQLLGMAAKKKVEPKPVQQTEEDLVCPQCGTTWLDFKNKGRLGCPNDYHAFGAPMRNLVSNQLAPLNAETETFHIGKTPTGVTLAADPSRATLRELERRLRQAVGSERYEEAAALKKEIDALKAKADETAN